MQLWNTQHRPERVLPALEGCLARLQLDYVDMFLIHWPFAYQVPCLKCSTRIIRFSQNLIFYWNLTE